MPGSTWERKDGRGGGRFTYETPIGTKTLTTTKATKEAADAWLAEKEADFAEGVVSGGESVGEFLDAWLAESVKPARARNTYAKRDRDVRIHIKPAFGNAPLSDLEPRRIQSLYASMANEGYAYATRREVHVTLKMALSQAVRWRLLKGNPCDLVDPPRDLRRATEEDEIRHLTDGQARELFRASEASRWLNFYVVAVRTGLRPGEMLGLRWGDLDLDGDPGSLRVRRSLDPHTLAFNPPKNEASRRTVALFFEAVDALAAQREMLRGEGISVAAAAPVFPSTSGTLMGADNLRKRNLYRDLDRAGLPRVTLHELRHSFASIMLHEWQVQPAIVSKMMGHSDIAFTFRVYGHLIPSADADVIRRLNELHGGAKTA